MAEKLDYIAMFNAPEKEETIEYGKKSKEKPRYQCPL